MKIPSVLMTFLTILVQMLLIETSAVALSPAFPTPSAGLFSNFKTEKFHLKAPFTTLVNAKKLGFFETKKVKIPGEISYLDEQGHPVRIGVEINIKGFSSSRICTFPKLELKISKKDSVHTLFENIKSVDLGTHCLERNDKSNLNILQGDQNNHREAFIYRLMQIANMPSFLAKPIYMSYEDTESPSLSTFQRDYNYKAFFLEDYGDFRKRNKLKAIRGIYDVTKADVDKGDTEKLATYVFSSLQESPKADLEDAARTALLQMIIGNDDWHIQTTNNDNRFGDSKGEGLWNVKIVEDSQGRWITFPQDFNFSMFAMGQSSLYPLQEKVFALADKMAQIKILRSFLNKKKEIYWAAEHELDAVDGAAVKNSLDAAYVRLDEMLTRLQGRSRTF